MKLYGRETGMGGVVDLKPCRHCLKGERKMIKARHRYQRRQDKLEIKP